MPQAAKSRVGGAFSWGVWWASLLCVLELDALENGATAAMSGALLGLQEGSLLAL